MLEQERREIQANLNRNLVEWRNEYQVRVASAGRRVLSFPLAALCIFDGDMRVPGTRVHA